MRLLSWILSAILIFSTTIVISPVEARIHQGGVANGAIANCPYPIDNGCSVVAPNGSFQNLALLTSAQQSGQVSFLPQHAPQDNIPGVDYAIGPDITLTPGDPRTINDTICKYNGSTAVVCQPVSPGQTVHEVINNYDFGGSKIGKSTVGIYMQGAPSAGSDITITNNYFSIFANTNTPVGFSNNWSIIFKYNQCDGTNAVATSAFCFRDDGDSAGTSLDVEYSAFTNQNVGRVAGGFRYMTATYKYNFIQGLNDINTSNHGEVDLRTCSQGDCTGFENYEGNFIIWNTATTVIDNTSTFFPSTGNTNRVRLSAFTMKNNIIVTNTEGTPATPTSHEGIGAAIFRTQSATLGDVTISGNWTDGTGAFFCSLNGPNGGNTITASASGNTITITATSSSYANNPIEVGWMLFHAGFSTASITAFGTAVGNLGTYTFDGAPQTVASDGAWTVVPGFSSQTVSDNWNLADPSHVGTPTAMSFSGPQMGGSPCLGAH